MIEPLIGLGVAIALGIYPARVGSRSVMAQGGHPSSSVFAAAYHPPLKRRPQQGTGRHSILPFRSLSARPHKR
jgi:hypothetical protein